MKRARDDVTVMEEEEDALLHEEGGGENGNQHVACDDVVLSLACGTSYEDDAVPRKRRRRLPASEFECRTCGRRFASFQALGGHRSSHLRVGKPRRGKPKAAVHACGVCGLGFEMGQALGSHMRRHRADGGLDLRQVMEVQQGCRPTSTLQLLQLFV